MKEKLQAIMESALKQIEEAVDSEKLNDARVSFLGKKGELTQVLKSLKDVAPEDRPKVGQLVNEAREAIEKRLDIPFINIYHLLYQIIKTLKVQPFGTGKGSHTERGNACWKFSYATPILTFTPEL